LGTALAKAGRHKEAAERLKQAATARPRDPDCHHNLRVALLNVGHHADAEIAFARALKIRPDWALALYNKGRAAAAQGRHQEALNSYFSAMSNIKSAPAELLVNMGYSLAQIGRPTVALVSYDRALPLDRTNAEVHYGRGNVLMSLKRPSEALASFDRAIAIRPDYPDALYNRGWTALLMGDFTSGWHGFERRFDVTDAPKRTLLAPYPTWSGEFIQGKRIIVYEEQGLGDIIQFSRYLRLLSSLGAHVTFLVRSDMHRLLQSCDQTIRLTDTCHGQVFDFQCALMSLPAAFQTTLDTIP